MIIKKRKGFQTIKLEKKLNFAVPINNSLSDNEIIKIQDLKNRCDVSYKRIECYSFYVKEGVKIKYFPFI